MSDGIDVEVGTDSITLGRFLKWAGAVETGGEAKLLIASGLVRVNGEVERRRGRQLRAGDIVELQGDVPCLFRLTRVPGKEL